jgi:hypothetical protein
VSALPSLDLERCAAHQSLASFVHELLQVVRMTIVRDRGCVAIGFQGNAGAVVIEQPLVRVETRTIGGKNENEIGNDVDELTKLGLAFPQLSDQMLLVGHVQCGADEAPEDFVVNIRDADPPDVPDLPVRSDDALFDVATRAVPQHSFQAFRDHRTVLRVDAGEIFVERRGSLGRIEAVNLEELGRPIVEAAGGAQRPASHMSKPLPFREIELAALLGRPTRDENAVRRLRSGGTQQLILFALRRHGRAPITFSASPVPSTRARILAKAASRLVEASSRKANNAIHGKTDLSRRLFYIASQHSLSSTCAWRSPRPRRRPCRGRKTWQAYMTVRQDGTAS